MADNARTIKRHTYFRNLYCTVLWNHNRRVKSVNAQVDILACSRKESSKIRGTVKNILTFCHPLYWLKRPCMDQVLKRDSLLLALHFPRPIRCEHFVKMNWQVWLHCSASWTWCVIFRRRLHLPVTVHSSTGTGLYCQRILQLCMKIKGTCTV